MSEDHPPSKTLAGGRSRTACAGCRLARRFCNRHMPCDRCITMNLVCVPTVPPDTGRKRKRPLLGPDSEPSTAGPMWVSEPGGAAPSFGGQGPDLSASTCVGGGGGDMGYLAAAPGVAPQDPIHPMAAPRFVQDMGVAGPGRERPAVGVLRTRPSGVDEMKAAFEPPRAGGGRGDRWKWVCAQEPVQDLATTCATKGTLDPPQPPDPSPWEWEREWQIEGGSTGGRRPWETVPRAVVLRPLPRERTELAFDAVCRTIANLSLQGKADANCASSVLAGLDYVRCVSGGTFWPPAYTGILKHVVRTGVAGRLPSSAPTSASPTSAMAHLLHYARNSVSPVEPSLHAGPSEEALPDPAKLPFYGQTHEEVEGTGGAPLSFSRRPRELECTETPGNVPEVPWINQLWDDPNASVITFIQFRAPQPHFLVRINKYMGQHFVDADELLRMAWELKTMPPYLISRFMTPESVERYYTTLTNTFNSEGTGEEACVVEMLNRSGLVVNCLATMRWTYGKTHIIIAAKFTPLITLPVNRHLAAASLCQSSPTATAEGQLSSCAGPMTSLPLAVPANTPLPAPYDLLDALAIPPLPPPLAHPPPPHVSTAALPRALPSPGLPNGHLSGPSRACPPSATQAASSVCSATLHTAWAAAEGLHAPSSLSHLPTLPSSFPAGQDPSPLADAASGLALDEEDMQILFDALA